MATYYVDPISRIEGHLGVNITESGGTVTEADVHGNLWRGFENFLIGRVPNDAITFTQRICGVCPVPHGMTSTFAVEAALGYNNNFQTFSTPFYADGVTEKALHIRNLILGSEFLMSSLTHFYHLAAPSYVQGPAIPPWTPYFADSYYASQLISTGHGITAAGVAATPSTQGALPALAPNGWSKDLWSAVITQYVKALRIRRLTFEAGALFSGRMPMTSAFIAGGVGFNHAQTDITARISKFQEISAEIGTFVVQEYVPLVLALGALYTPYDNTGNGGSGYGGGCGNFLAWGGFPQADGSLALSNGYMRTGAKNTGAAPTNYGATTVGAPGATAWGALTIDVAAVQANLKEDITHSRYAHGAAGQGYEGSTNVEYPGDVARTIPKRNDATKYSWLKAPRWGGFPMEVGPMARMFVMGIFKVGVELRTSVAPAGLVGYAAYAKPVTGTPSPTQVGAVTPVAPNNVAGVVTGLKPAMINPDLAVACVRESIATLTVVDVNASLVATPGTNLVVNAAVLATLSESTIAAAYYHPNAVITDGAAAGLATWVYNLKAGLSTMDRLRGRAIESLYTIQKMLGAPSVDAATGVVTWPTSGPAYTASWVGQLAALAPTAATYVVKATPQTEVLAKFGATEAPRGALMHFISINYGKITKYQCVVPTTWNGAPKDTGGTRGPIEEAMIGIPYSLAGASFRNQANTATVTTQGGVEALRVAQSFDPCIACAVH